MTEEWARDRLAHELADIDRRTAEAHARFKDRLSAIRIAETLPLSEKARTILIRKLGCEITKESARLAFPKKRSDGSVAMAEIQRWIGEG